MYKVPVSHVVTYYLVSVGILVRLFQYFHLGALATDKQYLLPQPKEVVLSPFVCVLCYKRTDLSFLSVFLVS